MLWKQKVWEEQKEGLGLDRMLEKRGPRREVKGAEWGWGFYFLLFLLPVV